MPKPTIYTEIVTLKITAIQKETLNKLKSKNYKVAEFIRVAIKEKLERDKQGILSFLKKNKVCLF